MEAAIPGSLRGKVWAWFLTASMSARMPGLFSQFLDHDAKGSSDERIDSDIASYVRPALLSAFYLTLSQCVVGPQYLCRAQLARANRLAEPYPCLFQLRTCGIRTTDDASGGYASRSLRCRGRILVAIWAGQRSSETLLDEGEDGDDR